MFHNTANGKVQFKLSVLFLLPAIALCVSSCESQQKAQEIRVVDRPDSKFYSFTLNDIDGQPVAMSQYKGKVLFIVNVASECRFTKQYTDLQKLYKRYQKQGFFVLGFPANNFGGQEPGTNAQIKQLCTEKFGITFPMFSKTSVAGDDINPLYAYLTDRSQNPQFGGPITWNFTKFLVDRNGQVVGRFYPETPPFDPEIVKAIKKALREP